MTIMYKNYKMESALYGGFDLTRKISRNKTIIEDGKKIVTNEKHEVDDTLGYNMSIPSCISRIVELELQGDENVYSLKEAVKVWNDKFEEIKALIAQ